MVWPFIRDPKFRQDLLSSEGEGSFNGFTVKGGTFLLLFSLLIGAFVFVLLYDVKPKELSMEELIAKINERGGEYILKNDDNAIAIYKDSLKLAKLNIKTDKGLNTTKGSDEDSWNISHEDVSKLGFVKMKHKENFATRKVTHSGYMIGGEVGYQIEDLDLYFRIDSVNKINREYVFSVTYGEIADKKNGHDEFIHWQKKNIQYIKTDDGNLNVESSFDIIQDDHWRNNYFIGMGLGYPHKDSIFSGFEFIRTEYEYVELINVIALEYAIE